MDRQLSSLKIVVLAAGFSARLGQAKPLARIHGETLLARTISTIAGATRQRVLIVTPPRARKMRTILRECNVSFLANPARAGGLSTSVALALKKTRWSAGTLLLPVDFAGLSSRDLNSVIRRWRGAKRCVVACGSTGRASVPLIIPKYLYTLGSQLKGDVGLRNLVAALRPDQRRLVHLSSTMEDIDSPAALAAARRLAPRRSAV